jgi:hypothetical protein
MRHRARQAFAALRMVGAGIVIEEALVVQKSGSHLGVIPSVNSSAAGWS